MQQLAHDIGQAGAKVDDSDLAIAMLQSMPSAYTPIVQGIESADKASDPVYVYTKLIDEEQRINSEKPQSGSNNKNDSALNAGHRISKPGETRKCHKCGITGHLKKNCPSNEKPTGNGGSNARTNPRNTSKSNNRKYPPCSTCKKTNHPEDKCFYKKIYEQAKLAADAEARSTKPQVWGVSPSLD
jgi:gag-polypeptide of LTR copia-type/Zinc knuckle